MLRDDVDVQRAKPRALCWQRFLADAVADLEWTGKALRMQSL